MCATNLNSVWKLELLNDTHTHTHTHTYIYIYIYHVVRLARISLTLSLHVSRSFIASGRSSGLHPVSSHSCCMYVRAGRPAFDWPYGGVHRSTSLTISSLLLQQRPACLVYVCERAPMYVCMYVCVLVCRCELKYTNITPLISQSMPGNIGNFTWCERKKQFGFNNFFWIFKHKHKHYRFSDIRWFEINIYAQLYESIYKNKKNNTEYAVDKAWHYLRMIWCVFNPKQTVGNSCGFEGHIEIYYLLIRPHSINVFFDYNEI